MTIWPYWYSGNWAEKWTVAVQHSRVSGSGGIQGVPGTKWSESQTESYLPRRAARFPRTAGSQEVAGAPAGSHIGIRQPNRSGASRPAPRTLDPVTWLLAIVTLSVVGHGRHHSPVGCGLGAG